MAGKAQSLLSALGLRTETEYDEEWVDERTDEPLAEVTPIRASTNRRRTGERERIAPAGDTMNGIVTVRARIYRDARTMGEAYREGVPVILNLTDAPPTDAQRLVDYACGLTQALHGNLERVTPQGFLLSPATVEVKAETGDGRRNAYESD